ncbi:MAG: hypothetical protein H7834_00110 [Magnetococcus sp. YQC-9]
MGIAELSACQLVENCQTSPVTSLSIGEKMKRIKALTTVLFILSVIAHLVSFYSTGTTQSVILSAGSAILSVAIGLFVLNIIVNSAERRAASLAIIRIFHKDHASFHDTYLMEVGRNKFGMEKFNNLLDRYIKNNGNPSALDETEREFIASIPITYKDEVSALLGRILEQLREIQIIIGISFNPRVTAILSACRQNIVELLSLVGSNKPLSALSDREKSRLCELYLDIHAALDSTLSELASEVSIELHKKLNNET